MFRFNSNKMTSIIYFITFFFIFLIAIFDPQNTLGLRYPLIFACFPIYFYSFLTGFFHLGTRYFIVLFSYGLPIWGFVVYMFRGDLSVIISDTSYLSTAIVFSLVNIISRYDIMENLKKAAILSGVIFAFVILITAYELVILKSSQITDFVIDKDIARVSFRDYGDYELPYVYYYASPLLILPIVILIERNRDWKSIVLIIVMLVALFLSGTRSHNIMSLVFISLLLRRILSKRVFYFAVFFICSSFLMVNSYDIYDLVRSMFDTNEASNSFKLSMLSKYIIMFNDPVTLLFGQGFQAVEWNSEIRSIVTESAVKTELTYLELYRVFGFFLPTIILGYFVYFLFRKVHPCDEFKKLILVGLLFDSAFNPHLFSTYGAVMLAVVFSKQSPFYVIPSDKVKLKIEAQC